MTELVSRIISESSYVFPIVSDLHIDSLISGHFKRQLALLEGLSAERRPDALISLGDLPAMLGRQQHASNERVIELLSCGAKMLSNAADAPLLAINGNHDGIGTDFFSTELWNEAIGTQYEGGLGHHEGKSPYFYADFGIYRFIFLSVPHGSDLKAELPTPLWSFGAEQLSWLRGVIGSSSGRKLVIFSHVPLCSVYQGDPTLTLATWDGKRERRSTIASLCGWIDDREKAEEIINPLARSGELLCAISGHEHFDGIYQPGEMRNGVTNRLGCCQVIVSSHPKYAIAPELLFEREELSIVCVNSDNTPALKLLCLKGL